MPVTRTVSEYIENIVIRAYFKTETQGHQYINALNGYKVEIPPTLVDSSLFPDQPWMIQISRSRKKKSMNFRTRHGKSRYKRYKEPVQRPKSES